MKQIDHTNPKAIFDIKKRPNNPKLFQNQKAFKEEFIFNTKKNMGKKYMQQSNIFKQKIEEPKKEHRQIVMSQEFIRSSKLYRLLKEQIDRCDSIFIKQFNSLNERKTKVKEQIIQIRSQNYHQKVALWELKNKLMELKIMCRQQQEQSKRLAEQNYGDCDGQQEQEAQTFEQNQNQASNLDQYQSQNNDEKNDKQIDKKLEEINQNNQIDNQENFNLNSVQNLQNGLHLLEEIKESNQNKIKFTQILDQLMGFKPEQHAQDKELSEQQKKEQRKQEAMLESKIYSLQNMLNLNNDNTQ